MPLISWMKKSFLLLVVSTVVTIPPLLQLLLSPYSFDYPYSLIPTPTECRRRVRNVNSRSQTRTVSTTATQKDVE